MDNDNNPNYFCVKKTACHWNWCRSKQLCAADAGRLVFAAQAQVRMEHDTAPADSLRSRTIRVDKGGTKVMLIGFEDTQSLSTVFEADGTMVITVTSK